MNKIVDILCPKILNSPFMSEMKSSGMESSYDTETEEVRKKDTVFLTTSNHGEYICLLTPNSVGSY